VDAYTGPRADGAGYLWLAGCLDDARREHVDAVLTLADILASPARAVLAEDRLHGVAICATSPRRISRA
jgi:hypothetical protein